MALKNTILGWLGRTPDKSDELEDAEIDEATREYSEERTDDMIDRALRHDARRVRVGPVGAALALRPGWSPSSSSRLPAVTKVTYPGGTLVPCTR